MGNTLLELFEEKELRGIRLLLIFKLAILLIMSVTLLIIDYHTYILFFFLAVVLIVLPGNFFMLRMLNRKKGKTVIGYFSLFSDILIMMILPYIWYTEVKDYVGTLLIMKYDIVMIMVIFVSANVLTFNPKYPIIAGFGALFTQSLILVIGMKNSDVVITSDFFDYYTTSAVHLGNYIGRMIVVFVLAGISTTAALMARRTLKKAVELEKVNSNLERYFSPSVIEKIESDESYLKESSTHNIAVMFCDIRGFTSFSEKVTPEEVISFLQEYHESMVKVIFKHHGTVDKFLGDGIMVTFGTPSPSESDADNAVRAAIEMQMELDRINRKRKTEGKIPLEHGIGIHFGSAIIGNIGTPQKLEYTVIGDAVNTGSRIESQCKVLGEKLLISKDLKDHLTSDYSFIEYKNISLKGKLGTMDLFSISG